MHYILQLNDIIPFLPPLVIERLPMQTSPNTSSQFRSNLTLFVALCVADQSYYMYVALEALVNLYINSCRQIVSRVVHENSYKHTSNSMFSLINFASSVWQKQSLCQLFNPRKKIRRHHLRSTTLKYDQENAWPSKDLQSERIAFLVHTLYTDEHVNRWLTNKNFVHHVSNSYITIHVLNMYCSIQYIINTYIVLNMIGLCGCVVVQKTGFPAHTW